MVEKITVNPESIRAYGNVLMSKSASDYDTYESTVTKTTDTVYGATEEVFSMSPPVYTMSFDSASYTTGTGSVTVQVTLKKDGVKQYDKTITVTGGGGGTGTGTTNINGVASITVTGITESGTLTASYWGSTATATVTYQTTNYSLAFSQSTYTSDMFGDVSVSCTLKNGNTPMSGQTITFSWEGVFGPQSGTPTTNSSGVAALAFSDSDFSSLPATVTATYSGATATCTIESGGGII